MSRSADRIYAHLDRWLTAGAATAYADRLETLRRLWLMASNEDQTHIKTAANRRNRASIVPVAHICRANPNSTNPGAHHKTP